MKTYDLSNVNDDRLCIFHNVVTLTCPDNVDIIFDKKHRIIGIETRTTQNLEDIHPIVSIGFHSN